MTPSLSHLTRRFSDANHSHFSSPEAAHTLSGAENGMARVFSGKALHAFGCGGSDNSWNGFLFRDKLSVPLQPLELLALEEPCPGKNDLFRHDSCGNQISIGGNVR